MARQKAETADTTEPLELAEYTGSAVKPVKIKAFKVDTSRCMALEGDVIDLPVKEADALIAKGDAEAA